MEAMGQLEPYTEYCPSIFVLAVDPFLRIRFKSPPDDTNTAFADVIATIIQSLGDLTTLRSNFDLFRDVSGLDLKIKKRSLIPLGK